MIEFVSAGTLERLSGPALAVGVFADRVWGPGADWAAAAIGERLGVLLDQQDFSGASGELAIVAAGGGFPFEVVFFAGLGDEADAETLRRAAGSVAKAAKRITEITTTLHLVDIDGAAAAVAEGMALGAYQFDKYRSEPKPVATDRVRFVGDEGGAAADTARRALPGIEGAVLTRDLINEPANGKSPDVLAGIAADLASTHGLTIRILDEAGIAAERLGGLAGVAAGAHNPPRLVELRYEPDDPVASLALVGKGIVFDSGGLSLKPPASQETMKTDMSGAAAVFGAMAAIARLGLPVAVRGLTPLTENMPGGGATRPGDVLIPRNGKSIEVLNTDAEGRLVLADALVMASEESPDLIVDLATLTGACHVALGGKIAGLWSNDDEAAARVLRAAGRAGEKVWRMPLEGEYRKQLKSEVADLRNIGTERYGGAIIAALFLSEYVEGVPWVHLDIAGPARWTEDEHYQTKGGSGFGVRTLVALAEDMATQPPVG